MTSEHIHLILNHVPILGTYFGLALLALGLARRSDELSRVALGVFVVAAVFTIPVYLTGQPAEHAIAGAPGLSEAFIEPHEKAAKIALIASEILGILALGALLAFRRHAQLPRWVPRVSLALSLLAGAWLGYTGLLGGQVRHTEVRPGFSGFPGAKNAEKEDERKPDAD
jgi:uncharacterized membrane protein